MYSQSEVSNIKRAAESGDAKSQFFMAGYYLIPDEVGFDVKPEPVKGVEMLKKAANQGLAEAQQFLGQCYEEGIGTVKDKKQAAEWYKKAAEQGNAEAQYNLFLFLYEGVGIEKNESQALVWLKKSAAQGLPEAKDALSQF